MEVLLFENRRSSKYYTVRHSVYIDNGGKINLTTDFKESKIDTGAIKLTVL